MTRLAMQSEQSDVEQSAGAGNYSLRAWRFVVKKFDRRGKVRGVNRLVQPQLVSPGSASLFTPTVLRLVKPFEV